jgi:signal transduction histidine kinase
VSLWPDLRSARFPERRTSAGSAKLKLWLAKLRINWAAARVSLTGRLIGSFVVAIIVALVVAGLVIQTLYDRSAERTFDARLNVYLAVLAGDAVSEEGELSETGDLGEPRFELPLSGWYWQIRRKDADDLVQASISLFDGTLSLPEDATAAIPGIRRGYTHGPAGEQVRMLERDIRLADGSIYAFAVAAVDGELAEEKAAFATNLWTALGSFALFLLAVLGLQVWYGLKPLSEVRRELWRVRLGQADRLDGRFPTELQPLVDDLNALIRSNAEIVERSRTHVGNLAHALKTPLSVILNEARALGMAPSEKIAEQADLMRERITHALDRARIAASANVIGAVTRVADSTAPILRSMERIYQERRLVIEASISENLRFRGERHDFEEIVGNLVDNACKWARSHVLITAIEESLGRDQTFLVITVGDDGPGLDNAGSTEVLKRGRRLDETKPGSGLGLSIVSELVSLYGGTLTLEESPAGGLMATVRLPAI